MDQDKNVLELIKEKFKQLPKELQEAITASDLPVKTKAIADKHSLMLDQLGMLQNEIFFVLIGTESSKDFVDNISAELNINDTKATSIASDVSEQIFNPVRTYLRKWEDTTPDDPTENSPSTQQLKNQQSISDLERIGGFTIEKSDMTDSSDTTNEGMYVEKRTEILHGLENPSPSKQTMVSTRDISTKTDPLVDHLLTTPTTIPPEHTTSSPLTKTEVSQTPATKPITDPYKEPIN